MAAKPVVSSKSIMITAYITIQFNDTDELLVYTADDIRSMTVKDSTPILAGQAQGSEPIPVS